MAKIDIEKLKETLAENGIDEETSAKIIADLENESSEGEDEPTEDTTPTEEEDGKTEEVVPPTDDVPPSDDVVPPGNDVVDDVPGDIPPVDVPPADVPPEEGDVPPTDVPPEEVPPTDQPPALPPFDPTELLGLVNDLQSKNEELQKTVDGLLARVESLDEALKTAGVLNTTEDGEPVGDDNARIPPSASVGADDAFDDVLGDIQKRSRRF